MKWSDSVIKILDELFREYGVYNIDWTQTNVFSYMSELLDKIVAYQMGKSYLWMVISIWFIAGTVFYIINANKKLRLFAYREPTTNNSGDLIRAGYYINGNARAVIAICLIVVSIVMAIVFLGNLFLVMKYITLPEAAIFEFVKENS